MFKGRVGGVLRGYPLPNGRDDDPGAGLGIGQGIVMFQPDAEVAAHMWKFSGVDAPGPIGELHGANEAVTRALESGSFAAGVKHLSVERGVMGRQEVRVIYETAYLGP